MTRLLRYAALALAAATYPGLLAQTPTPTPTATPTPTPTATPTPTPTPTIVPSVLVPASSGSLSFPNGGRYDASTMLLEADGTIWTASANENVIARVSADEKKVKRWTMPRDAAPSHLLKEPDGTFWVAQLGGFKVSRFDPATSELTEWEDVHRRPTAFVKAANGTLWLPETNGTLTNFDPATGTFIHWRSTDTANPISSLTYPFLDADGSIWTADFLRGNLLRYAPDGTKVTRWTLPDVFSQPSKIIRGPDGKLWISLFNAAQLATFDPATGEFKAYGVGVFVLPFDMKVYKDRIVYTEQQGGEVGVFDPRGATPADTKTLEAKEITLTSTTATVVPVKTTLVSAELDVTPGDPINVDGAWVPGLARYPAVGGAGYALVVDDARKRFLVGGPGGLVEVYPPIPASQNDHLYPAAASISGRGSTRWATQVVAWNRGTADSAGATVDAVVRQRLLPTDWIAGYCPTSTLTVGAGKLVSQADPLSTTMNGPDSSGAFRIETGATATKFADFHSWIRVYRTREDGGTYGFARNYILGGEAIATGETGVVPVPSDPGLRVNAGLFVVEAATGTVSLVDSSGAPLASPIPFRWPAGYHIQASTVFDAFQVAPVPSARVVFSVTKGRVLPFGTAIDAVSGDPMDLPFFGPKSAAPFQWLLGVERGGGTLGPTSRTDLQLFNAASADSTVTLGFRPARLASQASAPGTPPLRTLTVPAGRLVVLEDVVKTLFGLEGVAGSMDVVSDPPLFAFARVSAADAGGGRHGYGMPGLLGNVSAAPGSRAVFIQAADAGWDVLESELQVTNPADAPATVAVRAYDAEGVAAGQPVTLTVAPKEVVRVPSAFFAVAGFGTSLGRLEVVPAEGSAPVFATLVRQDRKTGDADAVVPYVVPAS